MDYEKKLTQNFCCQKCRGRSAIAKTLSISRGLPQLLVPSSDRYVFVSCTLCGYTEIYNPLVFAEVEEDRTGEIPVRLPQ